eukprot:GHVS01107337.1.p1 GENE.GHVS01107337.1~~GHVS01107337.1.p1  ORF type:complete len:187 (-),score=45.46 GHVS01107337.1:533-1093(-)
MLRHNTAYRLSKIIMPTTTTATQRAATTTAITTAMTTTPRAATTRAMATTSVVSPQDRTTSGDGEQEFCCCDKAVYRCFYDEYKHNHKYTSCFDKLKLGIKSGLTALQDPTQGDAVATVGDVFSHYALQQLHSQMKQDVEGVEVLRDKPLINSKWVDMAELRKLPKLSLGFVDVFVVVGFCVSLCL